VELVAFVLPEAYVEGIEQLIDHGRFKSRSDAVRFAVEELIHSELWRTKLEKSMYELPICARA
jgi:Arc/MetJ-type ribon-helix-helix transcriptional regulator